MSEIIQVDSSNVSSRIPCQSCDATKKSLICNVKIDSLDDCKTKCKDLKSTAFSYNEDDDDNKFCYCIDTDINYDECNSENKKCKLEGKNKNECEKKCSEKSYDKGRYSSKHDYCICEKNDIVENMENQEKCLSNPYLEKTSFKCSNNTYVDRNKKNY